MYRIPHERNLITITEAAKFLNVSKRTVYAAVVRGELRARYGGLHATRIMGVYLDEVRGLRPERDKAAGTTERRASAQRN